MLIESLMLRDRLYIHIFANTSVDLSSPLSKLSIKQRFRLWSEKFNALAFFRTLCICCGFDIGAMCATGALAEVGFSSF